MKDVTANAAADKGNEPLHTLPVKMLPVSDLVLHPQANRVPKMQDEKRVLPVSLPESFWVIC